MNLVLQTNSIWHDLTHFPLYDREVRSRRRSLTCRTKSWISSKTRISTCHVTGQLRFCKLRGLVLRKSRFHLRDRAPARSEQLAFSVFISSSRWTLLPMHSLSCCKAASPAPTTHPHTHTHTHAHACIHTPGFLFAHTALQHWVCCWHKRLKGRAERAAEHVSGSL